MKFLGKKFKRLLAGSLLCGLAIPTYAQQPASNYLDGSTDLPRAQATQSGTEYPAPPVAGQVSAQTAAQTSDTSQDQTANAVLQTAFNGNGSQQNLPTVVQQFA